MPVFPISGRAALRRAPAISEVHLHIIGCSSALGVIAGRLEKKRCVSAKVPSARPVPSAMEPAATAARAAL